MLKQAENNVKIEGILSEVNIREDVGKETKKPYIMGEIKILVSQDINGETKDIEIPVNLFATKEKKAGGINPAYEAIKKIQTDYTSLAACGGDFSKASCVRIDRGELGENAFWGNDGKLVSFPRIRTSFTTRINASDCKQKADFKNTIVVAKISDEVVKDEPTGRLIVKGIIPQYGEKVDIVDFIVASEEAINHIRTYWNEGDTVTVAGKVNFSSKTIIEEKTVGFGDPIREEKTFSVKELVITSGSASALEGDAAYNTEEISAALKERMAHLEELKEKKKAATAPQAPQATSSDFGF